MKCLAVRRLVHVDFVGFGHVAGEAVPKEGREAGVSDPVQVAVHAEGGAAGEFV